MCVLCLLGGGGGEVNVTSYVIFFCAAVLDQFYFCSSWHLEGITYTQVRLDVCNIRSIRVNLFQVVYSLLLTLVNRLNCA